jgi:hypothetical protein
MVTRCLAGLACIILLVGTGIAREKDRSPDEQAKELIAKYRALSEKEQAGPEGAGIIKQLKAIAGKLSHESREAIVRLEVMHNLRQISLALQHYDGKDAKPPVVHPDLLKNLLPYLDKDSVFPQRPRWEYKVAAEADISKVGNDDLAAGLNKLGEEGWELIGFERGRFILKRQR